MDLYEYQAKELFAAHGVPVLPGRTVETPEEAAAAAARAGRDRDGEVAGQDRWPGQGRRGEVRRELSDEAQEQAGAILGLDIKGHSHPAVLITPASDIAEEYYVSFLLDRSNRTFLAMATAEGGMEIEQLAEERPDALARIPVDAMTGVDAAKAAEIAAAGKFPAEVRGPGRGRDRQAVGDLRRRGRHPGRGEPAGQGRRGPGRRAGRQGRRWTRTPTSGTRATPRWSTTRGGEPAGGQGQGEGPELRQARTGRSASSATVPAW